MTRDAARQLDSRPMISRLSELQWPEAAIRPPGGRTCLRIAGFLNFNRTEQPSFHMDIEALRGPERLTQQPPFGQQLPADNAARPLPLHRTMPVVDVVGVSSIR